MIGTDAFDISNGALTFKSPPDYEAADSHTVTVQASDETTDPATQALTVTINNLDEAGSLTLSSEQPQVDAALTATLTDPDGASDIKWVWERSSNRSTWTEIDDETSRQLHAGDRRHKQLSAGQGDLHRRAMRSSAVKVSSVWPPTR